jgi:riboflavin kinase
MVEEVKNLVFQQVGRKPPLFLLLEKIFIHYIDLHCTLFPFFFVVPLANLEEEVAAVIPDAFHNGVYYGYASLQNHVYPMVMSIGTNPFFNNPKRSAEVHLLHTFENDFYGETLRVIIIGHIRSQQDYNSRDELIQAINNDIQEARLKLQKETHYQTDAYLTPP